MLAAAASWSAPTDMTIELDVLDGLGNADETLDDC
jgi:hypothetical protein